MLAYVILCMLHLVTRNLLNELTSHYCICNNAVYNFLNKTSWWVVGWPAGWQSSSHSTRHWSGRFVERKRRAIRRRSPRLWRCWNYSRAVCMRTGRQSVSYSTTEIQCCRTITILTTNTTVTVIMWLSSIAWQKQCKVFPQSAALSKMVFSTR